MDELLFNPDGPALSVLAATPSEVANLTMAWTATQPQWDILRVRGNKSRDQASFFDELAAALQFPYYFCENRNALWDCITELSWLRGASFLIVFDLAQHLLSESDEDFRFLVRTLADARGSWRAVTTDFGEGDQRPIAFHSVFACEPDAIDALTQRMTAAGAVFVRLVPEPGIAQSPSEVWPPRSQGE